MKPHAPSAPEARSALAALLESMPPAPDEWKPLAVELCNKRPDMLMVAKPKSVTDFVRFPHILAAQTDAHSLGLAAIITALRDKCWTTPGRHNVTEKAIAMAQRFIRGKSAYCDIDEMWKSVSAWLAPVAPPAPVPTSSALLSKLFLSQ